MEKIYIVTSGDSFTDSHLPFISSDDFDSQLGLLDKIEKNARELFQADYSLKYQYFLIYELIKKGIPFEYYNVGKGSAGNHVITHRYRKQINELLNRGINPNNIYGTIQLSGLCRQTDPMYEIEMDLPNVDGANWDYINNVDPNTQKYSDVLNAQIDNLENIINWNKENGIIHFNMFFGWATYYDDELVQYNAKNKFDKLDRNFILLYEYKESIDPQYNNCVGIKKIINSLFNGEKHLIAAGKYGGMSEIAKEECEVDKYPYVSLRDPHLSTFGNYSFYKKYYRILFEKWNIIDNNNSFEEEGYLKKLFKIVFDANFEYFEKNYDFSDHFTSGPFKEELKFKMYDKYISQLN